jgi:hypothetical protein
MRLRPLKESGTVGLASVGGWTVNWSPSRSTPAPTASRIRAVISTSPMSGTLLMVLGP